MYYRSASAARRLFDDDVDGGLGARLAGFAWLYLSGITLSILDPSARTRLWATLDDARRQGARVAFDTNYRPAGWADPGAARAALRTTLERVDLALPSLDDEQRLFGDADARACAQRLHAGGVGEVVVKQGAGGCLVSTGGRAVHVPATRPVEPVDTTAAGDAFNAAYLAARLRGAAPEAAARCGHRLAGAVVRHAGAIIPAAATPPLDLPGHDGAGP